MKGDGQLCLAVKSGCEQGESVCLGPGRGSHMPAVALSGGKGTRSALEANSTEQIVNDFTAD